MKLIGISGLARSGKDTLYNFSKPYLESLNKKHKRYAFADALKQEADELLSKYVGISAFTEHPSEKEIIRPFLVTYGTHVRRKLNPSCWVEKINDQVKQDIDQQKYVFITDVRFKNEIDWVHEMGGESIHITRERNIAPNQEELENDPILKSISKHHIEWGNFDEENMDDVLNNVNKLLSSII
jgi:hypothetical protein